MFERKNSEEKKWRAKRAAQLKEIYINQERQRAENARFFKTYFKAGEVALQAKKTIAENQAIIKISPFTEALYTDKELVQAKYIIEDENLPFEVRDGKIHYTGKSENFLDECLDLAAAIADRAPEIAESYLTSDSWLSKYVEGFERAYKAEAEREKKIKILIKNRIVYPDGNLTQLGKDMMDELRSKAEQSQEELKELEKAEQELYTECEKNLLADTNAEIAPGFFMLPVYLIANRSVKNKIENKKNQIAEIKYTETKLDALLEPLKSSAKQRRRRRLLHGLGIAGVGTLLALGAIGGAVAQGDGDDTNKTYDKDSEKDFNDFARDLKDFVETYWWPYLNLLLLGIGGSLGALLGYYLGGDGDKK